MPRWVGVVAATLFTSLVLGVVASLVADRWHHFGRRVRWAMTAGAVALAPPAVWGLLAPAAGPDADPGLHATKPAAAMGCRPDDDAPPLLEGSVGVRRASDSGENSESLAVADGTRVRFQAYVRSREVAERNVANLHVRLALDEEAAEQSHIVVMDACGTNTNLLRDAVTLHATTPVRLRFVRGSVMISVTTDGVAHERAGTDDFVVAPGGHAIGPLLATAQENDVRISALADVVAVD